MIKENFIEISGIKVHYFIAGEGKPVLLLHGVIFSAWTYRKCIFSLAEKYLVNRGALSGLVESIGFDKGITAESLDRVHAGLLALAASDKDSIEKMIGEIKGLVAEFDAEQQRTLSSEAENIDRVERERLRGIGISGSAVAEINVKAGAAWRQVVEGIRTRFAERLESLKKRLAEVVVKS